MIRLMVVICLAVSSCASALAQPFNDKDVTVYRDKEAGFILSYQKSWARVPSTHERTRIKVVSQNGNGGEDCLVNVQVDEQMRKLTAAEAMRVLRDTEPLLTSMKRALPDVKLVQERPTYLSNKEAMLRILTMTYRSPIGDVPMKMVMVTTVNGSRLYSLSCRASPEDFDKNLPVFMLTFAGFLLTDASTR